MMRGLTLFGLFSLMVTATAASHDQGKGSNTCKDCCAITVSDIHGAPGLPGDNGVPGQKGENGDRGLRGIVGSKGVKGESGCNSMCRVDVCSNGITGMMRYSHQRKNVEYCDGTKWITVPLLSTSSSLQYPTITTSPVEYTSCKQIATSYKSSAYNGQYWIRPSATIPAFQVYCDVSEGWTLIMKIDGNKQTFIYDSALWSNKQTHHPNNLALDNKETKLASYWTLPFAELRLGMKVDGTIRWIRFSYTASSLYSLIADGQYRKTSIGESKWRSLLPRSSLQRNCNKEGFNAAISYRSSYAKARLGIIANQENNCYSPDSFVGFGTQDTILSVRNSAGNFLDWRNPDNGPMNTKAIGYIMAR